MTTVLHLFLSLLCYTFNSARYVLTRKTLGNHSQRRVEQAKRVILLFQQDDVRRFRGNTLRNVYHCAARCINTRPVSAAHSGQQRRTVSGALFGLYYLNFVPIDVCLNLSPKRGTSASTSKPDGFNWNV